MYWTRKENGPLSIALHGSESMLLAEENDRNRLLLGLEEHLEEAVLIDFPRRRSESLSSMLPSRLVPMSSSANCGWNLNCTDLEWCEIYLSTNFTICKREG